MLGLGRAIGETIAATLVIGNAPDIGKNIFAQGYTLAAVIANEFGEAASDPTHRAALIAAGLVLFVLHAVRQRAGALLRAALGQRDGAQRPEGDGRMSAIIAPVPARRRRTDKVMRGVLLARHADRARPARARRLLPAQAGSGRAVSWDFFTTDPTGRFLGPPGGVKSAIVGTILIVGLASLIAIPIGIGVALYLVEYGKKTRVRQLRPLLRRRDDRRAVDRLRPVHLHRAGADRASAATSPAGRARSRSRC